MCLISDQDAPSLDDFQTLVVFLCPPHVRDAVLLNASDDSDHTLG